jgi:hypothetical protein
VDAKALQQLRNIAALPWEGGSHVEQVRRADPGQGGSSRAQDSVRGRFDRRHAVGARWPDCPGNVLRLAGDARRNGPCGTPRSPNCWRCRTNPAPTGGDHPNRCTEPLKMWTHPRREGIHVARCTVERLMKANGWRGTTRVKKIRTTIADPAATRAPDLVNRKFAVETPNRLFLKANVMIVARGSNATRPGPCAVHASSAQAPCWRPLRLSTARWRSRPESPPSATTDPTPRIH